MRSGPGDKTISLLLLLLLPCVHVLGRENSLLAMERASSLKSNRST